MIIHDPELTDDIEVAACYLKKIGDGTIVVVNKFGEIVGDTVNVVVDNGVSQATTATVTLVPNGWYEDIADAD